jgi:ABC-2 type transport system ATP-binding protein
MGRMAAPAERCAAQGQMNLNKPPASAGATVRRVRLAGRAADASPIIKPMSSAIATDNLTKAFGPVRAVESVGLRVAPGEIYGFLGLNGAGKTTTIRLLLGMVRPTAGSATLLGEPVGPHGRGPWRRVGHMVESPAAWPELTVRENLEVARRLQGVTDPGATGRAVERLGLAEYADRRAGTLSSGNRLRLGLARALLHEPELLILDEPASGLDPAGVVEVREMLAGLARDRGVTVFMSSHVLTEVDRLATRIGIIHRGRLIEELSAERLEALRARRLEVEARDLGAAQAALARAGYAAEATGKGLLLVTDPRALEAPDAIAALLVNAGAPPTRLAVVQEDLESYFLRLTGGAP